MSLRKVLLATTFLSVVPMLAAPAPAMAMEDDIVVLKEENAKLQKSLARLMSRMNRLEKRSKRTAKAAKKVEKLADTAITKADDGSFLFPGGTKLKIGGYVKLDAIHDIGVRPTDGTASTAADSAALGSIQLDSASTGARKNSTRFHARQSRFNISSSTPTSWGDVGTFIEMDFFGAAGSATFTNSHSVRLRHAYVTFDNWMIGQGWSTFVDTGSMADTLDFNGPAASFGIRQPQIRYTADLGDGHTYAMAIENPESDFTDSTGTANTNTINRWPDLIAKWRYGSDGGHVGLAGVLRNIAYDSGKSGTAPVGDKSVVGYGLALSGKWKPFAGESGSYAKDNIIFQLIGGEGVGRYLTEGANMAAAVNNANGSINSQFAWGGFVGLQHYWVDSLRSTLVYGYTDVDVESYMPTTTTKRIDSLHANLIWSPIPSMDIGAEYIYGRREIESGEKGNMSRIQGSVTYRF